MFSNFMFILWLCDGTFKKKDVLYYCVCVFDVYELCICVSAHRGQKRMSDPLQLKCQMLWVHRCGCGESKQDPLPEQETSSLQPGVAFCIAEKHSLFALWSITLNQGARETSWTLLGGMKHDHFTLREFSYCHHHQPRWGWDGHRTQPTGQAEIILHDVSRVRRKTGFLPLGFLASERNECSEVPQRMQLPHQFSLFVKSPPPSR